MNALQKHTLPMPVAAKRARSIIDVGAGIRPVQWYPRALHVCIEPFGPYADVLEAAGFLVVRGEAPDALVGMSAAVVVMLDVIEHMSKADGLLAIALAKASAGRQVVVYTPLGFVPQTEDAWGMGGDFWQTHRSGWVPGDFPGWAIEEYMPEGATEPEGFYATWTRA